jgi:cell division protease FtsH
MADLLLEKETIYAEDIEPILGPSAQSLRAKAEKAETEPKAEEQGVTITPEEPALEQSAEESAEQKAETAQA